MSPRDGRPASEGLVRIAVELSDEDVLRIADRTAALLRAEVRSPGDSPYMTIAEAAAYLRCRRQRIDDLLSQRRLSRIKEGTRTLILHLRRGAGDPSAVRWDSAA